MKLTTAARPRTRSRVLTRRPSVSTSAKAGTRRIAGSS
jgi:hypothetical protein